MIKRTPAIMAGALALLLGLSACSQNGGGTSPTTTPTATDTSTGAASSFSSINAQPASALKDGGTLTMSIGEFTAQKNQFQQDGTVDTWTFWDWYNPELIKFKPNGDLDVNPNYLTAVTPSTVDGKTVVTYEINPKAQFNDGTPIDVAAFQNTWKADNGSDAAYLPNSTDGWNKIESVEAGKDSREVVVTFVGPWPWWGGGLQHLAAPGLRHGRLLQQWLCRHRFGLGPPGMGRRSVQVAEL